MFFHVFSRFFILIVREIGLLVRDLGLLVCDLGDFTILHVFSRFFTFFHAGLFSFFFKVCYKKKMVKLQNSFLQEEI